MRHTKNNCAHTNTTPARMRGQKVRYQCTSCGHLSKWTKPVDLKDLVRQNHQDAAIARVTGKPVVVTTQVTTQKKKEGTKMTTATTMDDLLHDAADMTETLDSLDDLTVPELRARAKDGGVKGYSKMNKADLITALTAGLPTR